MEADGRKERQEERRGRRDGVGERELECERRVFISEAIFLLKPQGLKPPPSMGDLLAFLSDTEPDVEDEFVPPADAADAAALQREDLALVVVPVGGAAVPAVPAVLRPRRAGRRRGHGGTGSRGNIQEKCLISSLMHMGKIKKRRLDAEKQRADAVVSVVNQCRLQYGAKRKLAKLFAKGGDQDGIVMRSMKFRRRGQKWLTSLHVLDMSFGKDAHLGSKALGIAYGVDRAHARRMRIYTADCFLRAQLYLLGWRCKLATDRQPDIVVSRLAWDETGEKLTSCLPQSCGTANQQRSTWQVMVSRVRIVVCLVDEHGGRPTIIDWVLNVPPVVVRTPSAPEIYYGLFHSHLTRPIMMGRFLLMQRAKLSVDLSETDHAGANVRLEAYLLHKATTLEAQGVRPMLKAHLPCRLHQQQLIEVLLLAVTGSWVLSRLYSFTLLLRGAGMFLRLVSEYRAVLQTTLLRPMPRPPDTVAFLKEMRA